LRAKKCWCRAARTGIATALFCAERGAHVTATERGPRRTSRKPRKVACRGVTLELAGTAQKLFHQDLIVRVLRVSDDPVLAAARAIVPVWTKSNWPAFLRGA